MHVNIRSVPANLSSLSNYTSSLEKAFDVIALTETWLQHHNIDSYNLHGYKMESRIRENCRGGGVSILLKESLHYKLRMDLSFYSDSFESIFLEITNLSRKVLVAAIYRPPGTDLDEFNRILSHLLDSIRSEQILCYLMGDFNVDLLKSELHRATSEFCDILFSHSFLPLISKPTRITTDSFSLIDNIFTNSVNYSQHMPGILYADISDHLPVFALSPSIRCSPDIQTNEPTLQRDFSSRNIVIFRAAAERYDWSSVLSANDPQSAYTLFHNALLALFNECFPFRLRNSVYKNRKPWLTAGLKNSIKMKNLLYVRSHRFPSDANAHAYKVFKTQLRHF